ncbi:hypothetical protein BCV69DRAFT_263749, partial [Microstroma glucosiphilum]
LTVVASCLHSIVNAIASVFSAIIGGIASICNATISCITCQGCGGGRRGGGTRAGRI